MRTALPFLLALLFPAGTSLASRLEHGRIERVTERTDAHRRTEVLLELARSLDVDRPVEALAHRRTAVGFADQSHDLELMHLALVELRRSELEAGGLDGVLRASLSALEVAQRLGQDATVAEDLKWLSSAYAELGQPVRAMEESQRALLVVRGMGDSLRMAEAHLDVMERLVAAGRYREAHEQGRLADALLARHGDPGAQARRWMLGATSLLNQRMPSDALPFLGKAASLLGPSAPTALRIALRKEQVRAALGVRDLIGAGRHIDSLDALVARSGDRSERLASLDLRQRLARAKGDERTALAYLDRYVMLKDSLLNQRMARQLAGMQALYEVSAKDRDNAMLRERNTMNEALITSAARRGRKLSMLLGAVSALTVLFGLTLFHNRRVMRRVRAKGRLVREQGERLQAQNLELERQNERLARSTTAEGEKDLMLREIHHRLKNDLQVVCALLRLRALHEPSAGSRKALDDLEHRVRAMALVHERLYGAIDLRRIGLRRYMQDLLEGVVRSHAAEARVAVSVSCTLDEVPVPALVPLGLLVNELAMNSLKHAFPDGRPGSITLTLDAWNGNGLRLHYRDDGVGTDGLPKGSFGRDLLQALTEQLEGELRIEAGGGLGLELLATLGQVPHRMAV